MVSLTALYSRMTPAASTSIFSAPQSETLLRTFLLALILTVSFTIRLFSVLRYESIIHEFDPWFNFRATKLLTSQGPYAFWNWFDARSWYPLGRIVGGTVYPGIMATAATMHALLNAAGLRVDIREVCVLTAPTFSALTALAAYALTTECADRSAGILAAALVSIVPGYISRSVAGSYDNEGVAITAMIFTFYMWTKAVVTGSLLWAAGVSLAYLYMVSTWGGYIFLINVIPVYVLVMMVTGRYSHRLYVAYNTFYVVGTLLSMQIRFVGFNAVQTPEHLGAFGVFGLINLLCVSRWVKSFAGQRTFNAFLRWLGALVVAVVGTITFLGAIAGKLEISSGRILTLLDPTYATKHIAIVASVSEHQPTAWGSYFFDLHLTAYLMPLGLYVCFKRLTDANLFLVTYAIFSAYFSGVMVRIMLVFAPAAAMLSAIGISASLRFFMRSLKVEDGAKPSEIDYILARAAAEEAALNAPADAAATRSSSSGGGRGGGVPGGLHNGATATTEHTSSTASTGLRRRKGGAGGSKGSESVNNSSASSPISAANGKKSAAGPTGPKVVPLLPKSVAMVMASGLCVCLFQYVRHSIWATSEAYSSPSVVLSARARNGERIFFDDYRAGYYWLRQNTDYDAKVMSWWDYGYQISGMADRSVIVDNNTWNNTHIATVGKAMNSPEEAAYKIARKLDVDYVLVVFGGVVGYSSDDINKFLWMVRISSSVDKSVKEEDYLNAGRYSIGADGGEALRNSLMYRLCYYRFDEMIQGGQAGFDRVRQVPMKEEAAKIKLKYFEEAFTSENWIVRIYRVKKPDNLGFT